MSKNVDMGTEILFSDYSVQPSSRMCHTITDMGDLGSLLVGGRTSPDNGLIDCWIYHKWVGVWEPVDDLPYPLYRHQAVYLGNGCVLISTGRINSQQLSEEYLIWSRRHGWLKCHLGGQIPPKTYGAIFTTCCEPSGMTSGILVGGLSEDAVVQAVLWHWELDGLSSKVSDLYLS
jgi:tRNA wybutosine-synthesizing protein 4